MSHLAELRDVASPSSAERVGAEFWREPHFASDLRRVRPWLADGPPRALLGQVFQSEWTGFLALLAEAGPWVYAPTVRDLQGLATDYHALRRLVLGARARRGLALLHGGAHPRPPGGPGPEQLGPEQLGPGPPESLWSRLGQPGSPPPEAVQAEAQFWQGAHALAAARRAEWQQRGQP